MKENKARKDNNYSKSQMKNKYKLNIGCVCFVRRIARRRRRTRRRRRRGRSLQNTIGRPESTLLAASQVEGPRHGGSAWRSSWRSVCSAVRACVVRRPLLLFVCSTHGRQRLLQRHGVSATCSSTKERVAMCNEGTQPVSLQRVTCGVAVAALLLTIRFTSSSTAATSR